MVFFSRDAHQDYKIHTAFFDKFANSLEIDLGILELFRSIATDGILAVVAHVRVINLHDFAEVYLNVMLLIPLGYLLPYIFRWYRAKVHVRPVVTAFLLSLLTTPRYSMPTTNVLACRDASPAGVAWSAPVRHIRARTRVQLEAPVANGV